MGQRAAAGLAEQRRFEEAQASWAYAIQDQNKQAAFRNNLIEAPVNLIQR